MKNSVLFLLVRAFVYMLMVAGLAQLVTLEGYELQTASEYSEQSLTENLQTLLSLTMALGFIIVALIDKNIRPAAVMLASLAFMMFIREADAFLDTRVFDGAWQALVSLTLIVTFIFLWKQRNTIAESINRYAREPSAGILLSGILVTLVFSRLFGRASFWQAVMGEDYLRVVKNIAEEGTELLGYGLLAIAAIEMLVVSLMRLRNTDRPRRSHQSKR